MANHQSQYKINNNFGNIKNNRAKRARISELKRKEQRIEDFSKKRELEIIPIEETEDLKDSRYRKLLKWRAERDRLKKMEQTKKKPAFKVGVVHHNYYSPPIKDSNVLPPIKSSLSSQKQVTQPTLSSKRITRATEKRLLRKQEILTTEVPPKQNVTEKKQEKSEGKNKRKNNVKTEQKSFAPDNYKFTAPSGITSMPLFGRVKIILTPVKDSKSIKNKTKEEISSLNEKPESLDQECNEKTDINDKMPSTSIINNSIETLKNNREMTFDFLDKEGEFLRNSTFSDDSNHSKIILSPGNISAIRTEEETYENSSNNKIKTSFSKNISKEKVISESPKNINSNSTKETPPSTKDNANLCKDPAYFSPYIVSSRGKSNARKEQQLRRGIGSPSDSIPTKETVMQTLNLSIEDEERTAQYFAFLLKKETDKLNELINKWTYIQKESHITEDAQYLINQAIGQTRLLINKKFERFQRLVSDCESGKGEMLVTCRDLQGFWDMMYMEIQNCDSRFEALEKLRSRGWEEEQEEIVAKVKPKRKVVSKKKVVPKKKSSVQAFILAAKQKMKNNTNNPEILQEDANKSLTSVNNIDIENRDDTLINGDIKHLKSTDSKDKLSVVATNRHSRQSLLKETLLSETCKVVKTPMTIMKISQMYKTPKIQLDDSISYINCKQTPSKSILKRSDDFPINNIHLTRSTQKVNFNDQVVLNELSIDEEAEDSLAARLARIDSYDLDNEYVNNNMKIERKLEFDNSFQDSENNLQFNNKQLLSSTVTNEEDNILLNHKTCEQFNTNASSPKNQNILNMSLEESPKNKTNRRTLRNRTIVTENSTNRMSTRNRKSNIKDLIDEKDENNQKENNSPLKSKKKSRKKSINVEEKEVNLKKEIYVTPVNVKKELRRSSRKSVKFNAEECEACEESKFTLPMTPYVRCSKGRLSFLQDNNTPIKPPSPNRDLISWDTPKTPVRVVRRSTRNFTKHVL